MAKSSSIICLLDDDPSVLKATGRLLSSVGWEVATFSDPHAFLRHAQTHHPRLVVIDIWMPGVSGLQVRKELQAISPKTRVIIVTANDDDSVRNQAMKGGTSALFIKPFDDDEFLTAVYQAMASAA